MSVKEDVSQIRLNDAVINIGAGLSLSKDRDELQPKKRYSINTVPSAPNRVGYTGNNTIPTTAPTSNVDTVVLLNGSRYEWNGTVWVAVSVVFDATVNFSTLTPTTGGVVFTPNTPASTTVLYVSSVDGSQWTYNGTIYVPAPASNDWRITGNVGMVQATNFVGTTDNVGLSFRTNNVIRQTISNTGNAGIGTTTPLTRLDVNGSGWFGVQKGTLDAIFSIGANILNATAPTKITTQAITTPETALRLFSAGTTGVKYNPSADFSIGTYATGVNALTKLNIMLGNNATQTPDVDVMTLQGNGNVGIGTTAPTAKLEINNVTAGSGLKFTQLNASSTPTAGATPLGVDASGNVVATPSNIFISVNGGNQNIGQAFTTVAMPNIVTVTGVPASNYNTTTSGFTVPITGVYEITGTIRYSDGQPAGKQFGVGVHTANSDGPFFLWHAIQNTTFDGVLANGSRRTSFPYIRVERFTAGQTLRMISYVDGTPMNVASAAMQIRFLF